MDFIEAADMAIPGRIDAGESEKALIRRALSDPDAFVALYRRHYESVASYLYRRTGDRHVTEDLLNEVFFAAHKGLRKYRHRGAPFKFWLWGIATNLVNQWARRNHRRVTPIEEAGEIIDPSAGHAAVVEDRDEQESALKGLLKLEPIHQAVLALHYLEGLSVVETASVLKCRPGTVKSRLNRARRALRRQVKTGGEK